MNKQYFREYLLKHEVRDPKKPPDKPYFDSRHHPTIGVGFNLAKKGARHILTAMGLDYDKVLKGTQPLRQDQIDKLLDHDMDTAIAAARHLVPNFDQMSEARQLVVADMAFNLGQGKLAGLEKTLGAMRSGDWETAAREMKDSLWFHQTGNRAKEDVEMMRSGQYPNAGGTTSPTSPWLNIGPKPVSGGAPHVTDEQKNALIERAVDRWEGMGLSPQQMALGITMMAQGPGFYPGAIGKSGTGRGLGQFTDAMWSEAAKRHNEQKQHWPPVDPVKGRDDYDAQISVMGAWIPHVWERAGEIAGDRKLKRYGRQHLAFGKWKGGQDADAGTVAKYLNDYWKDPNVGGDFDRTYSRAMQALSLRKSAAEDYA